jgi:hypothetical protein
MVLGLADNEAVGAAGGGGGGGGGGATFFLQAPSVMIAINTNANIIHLMFRCFTLVLRNLGARRLGYLIAISAPGSSREGETCSASPELTA